MVSGVWSQVRRRGDDALSPSTVITRSPPGLTQLPKPNPTPNPDPNNLDNEDVSSLPSIGKDDVVDEDDDEDKDKDKDNDDDDDDEKRRENGRYVFVREKV